jgi:hypothetical protein
MATATTRKSKGKKFSFPEENIKFNVSDVEFLCENPHVLGHLAGKTKLEAIHSEWIKYIWNPDLDGDVALQAFRGSYKTTSIVHLGPVWVLLFWFPDWRIFIIRKDFTAASNAVETIHEIILSSNIRSLFTYVHGVEPKPIVKRKEKITYNFKNTITPEGNLNPLGLDPSIAGKHGDGFICDDFVNLKDRISKAERNRTKEIIREVATNIADPGRHTRYVGTPWHKDDAWTICPPPITFNVYELPLLTEDEIRRKRAKTTGSLWAANYELSHVADDDALFREPNWGKWKTVGVESVRAHLDAAFDGDHFNALTIMAKRSDGKLQGIGFSYAGNVKEWAHQIVTICKKFSVRKLYIEDNPDKGYTADDLKRLGMSVSTYTETINKHVKIATFLKEAWNDIIWDEEQTDAEYMNQILDYRERQEPDDGADSAASLIRACFSKTGAARMHRWVW